MAQIDALAYVVAQSTDIEQWRHYGEQVVGMAATAAPDDGLYLKMDERPFRFSIIPGDEDRYFASGWEVANKAAFEQAVAELKAAGVELEPADDALKSARQVTDLVSFTDPSGNRHELTWGHTGEAEPFKSPIGVPGFKTGEYGLGHTVLPALEFDATEKLFVETLGFGLSDEFKFQPAPEAPEMRMHFMHCNGRHHSLALGEMPHPAGCIHVMVEVDSMTEVGKAHDRMQENDVKLMATLGQHENDHMTSFYMNTPSNFALEFGWNGMIVNPETHETTHGEQVSIWGHDFSVGFQ